MLRPGNSHFDRDYINTPREYTEPKDALKEAFWEWKAKIIEFLKAKGNVPEKEAYDSAINICEKYDLAKRKAEDLAPICILFYDRDNEKAAAVSGYFLSACHNLTADNLLTAMDPCVDHKIYGFGYDLSKDKTLILPAGLNLGVAGKKSKGTIISYSDIEFLGPDAESGLIINKGKTESLADYSACVAINCADTNMIGYEAKNIILAVKNPIRKLYRNAKIVMDEEECKKLEFYETLDRLVKAEPNDVLDIVNQLRPYLDKI